MLVLGQIVEIAPKDSQPLRTVITVRPELDLARVSQLFLWIPNETRSSETEAAR
jgi:cell shape-determining protein MreC